MNFQTFAAAHGVIVNDLFASERIVRVPTESHPRKKNGALFFDGQRGWIFDWAGDAQVHWWNDPDAAPWTEAEQEAFKRKQQQARAKKDDLARKAAAKAQSLIKRATLGPHAYLSNRGLKQELGLVIDETLIVPMRHYQSNNVVGAQTIKWLAEERRFEKKMIYGMRAKGAVMRLGRGDEVILCEGYATGLTIKQAVKHMHLNCAVIVAFSDTNMTHVCEQIGGRRFIMADNDASGAGERAAQAAEVPYVMADTVGWDMNDLQHHRGLSAVCDLIRKVRSAA